MQRREKICAVQLLCKCAAHSTQTQVWIVLQKSYSFSLYLFSDSLVSHADYHRGDSSNWPPRYSTLSLQHTVNVQSRVWTSHLNIYLYISLHTDADTVVTLRGLIWTDVYGSNTQVSTNGLNVRFLRYRIYQIKSKGYLKDCWLMIFSQ